jgi:hypothetical protein
MKSWISIFLPNDEYKEKKLLYFLTEGSVILFLSLIIMIICNRFMNLDVNFVLLLSIAIFLFYVLGRYIISGIEYTDIVTEQSYRIEMKVIFSRTCSFIAMFILLYFIFVGFPGNQSEWFEVIGLLLVSSILWYLTSFISLTRSYKKNKELL